MATNPNSGQQEKKCQLLHHSYSVDNSNITSWGYSRKKHTEYDAWQYSGGTAQILELKYRPNYSLDYLAKYGARIEQDKFNALVEWKKKTNEAKGIDPDIIYVNYTDQGSITYLIPEHYNYNWEYKWCQTDNYTNTKKQKWCCDLPKELIIEQKYTIIKYE